MVIAHPSSRCDVNLFQEKVSCTRGNFHSPSIHLPISWDFCTRPIFFSLYFKAKGQWNKGMSDFDSGNSVNCVLFIGHKPI